MERNYTIDGEEIDLFILTNKRVYVVEVKVKPKHKDINDLVRKVSVAKSKYAKLEVKGILTGTYIGKEIKEYAHSKGIEVYPV